MDFMRAHVVGSMLRPTPLLDQLPRFRAGEIDTSEFKRIEDKAVDEAIRIQERAGIELITDGEQRRLAFGDVFGQSVKGIAPTAPSSSRGMWKGKQRRSLGSFAAECSDRWHDCRQAGARRISGSRGICVCARSRLEAASRLRCPAQPSSWPRGRPSSRRALMPSFADALKDIVEILNQEVHALARLGCQHIQFDAPELMFALDANAPMLRNQSRKVYCAMVVDHLNAAAVEPGVTFSVHFCRGNARGHWHSAGGYEAISKLSFPHLRRFQYILLEYDTDRAGGFEALVDLPKDCCAVLGLVTTKTGALESGKLLRERIDEASRYFPFEQMALSPQCGFASDAGGNPITVAEESAKLQLVGEVAREVWK